MVLALLCATKICSFEYKLEDILLTYMAFIEHSNLFINRGSLFLNPNQNSRIHYAEYEFDSGGNKILKVFDSEMDFDTKEILDEAFKSFSGLDYYILMKEYGMFGEQIRNQEMCDFVVTSLFQKLLIEDETIRSKADPVKTAYNKKNKIKKALASLNGKVNMSDLIGTIETYVEDKLKSYIK